MDKSLKNGAVINVSIMADLVVPSMVYVYYSAFLL